MVTLDESLVAAVRRDWRSAPLSARERQVLTYVERLTREAASCGPADLEALREAGFDDVGILQINLIASFFSYVNRVADGLGVGRGTVSACGTAERQPATSRFQKSSGL